MTEQLGEARIAVSEAPFLDHVDPDLLLLDQVAEALLGLAQLPLDGVQLGHVLHDDQGFFRCRHDAEDQIAGFVQRAGRVFRVLIIDVIGQVDNALFMTGLLDGGK